MTQAMVSRLLGYNSSGGGTDAEAAAAPQAQSMASAAIPNPVLKFLNQREEPKVVSIKAETDQQKLVKSNAELRRMHHAGGYDFSSYERRNWSEIMQGI